MITAKEMEKFAALRNRVFYFIEAEGEGYQCINANEGKMSISFPSLQDEKGSERVWAILLDCYHLGSMRHFNWLGKTLMEAIDNAATQFDMLSKERMAA